MLPKKHLNLSNTDFFINFASRIINKEVMIEQSLTALFPPVYSPGSVLLLVTPDFFERLVGVAMGNCRFHLFVCSGSLELDINGEKTEMRGCSFIDVIDTVRVSITKASSDLRAWCLIFTYEFASESLKTIRPFPLDHIIQLKYTPKWCISQKQNDIIEFLLTQLKVVIEDENYYHQDELLKSYFRVICLEIGNIMLSYLDNGNQSQSSITKKDIILWNFVRMVSTHFKEHHNIDFYADSLCISSKHLTRIVKEKTGNTPYSFISHEILHKAMEMLEKEELSVAEIAYYLNFSDQAAFCKFFKKHKSISPMAYRRRFAYNQ